MSIWRFPLLHVRAHLPRIPINQHPGAFGALRHSSHDGRLTQHTGVDIYCERSSAVLAVESGLVIGREMFTGAEVGSPEYYPTQALLVAGESGVVCYGEMALDPDLIPDTWVNAGRVIGRVAQVLPDERYRADVPGHSTSMLHLELYGRHAKTASTSWQQGVEELGMTDPTPYLIEAWIAAYADRKDTYRNMFLPPMIDWSYSKLMEAKQ